MNTKRLKDLKKQLGIGRVLEAYGLCTRLKQSGNQLIGACPLHGGDNPTTLLLKKSPRTSKMQTCYPWSITPFLFL